jgi:hypothetical protein
LKNIQIVDGAINSTFDIFEIDDEKFDILFPNNTDISFLDDYPHLSNDKHFWSSVYSRRVNKKKVNGIHGTLHLTGSDIDKNEFPNRKETDVRK